MFWKKKKESTKRQLPDGGKVEILHNEEDSILKVVKSGETTGKDNKEMLEYFSEQNDIPIFKGEIKHGYESDFLGYKDVCPNCDAPTKQMMSNFAYGTQEASRIASAPAGHFCTNCTTVIIDDDIMRAMIDPKFIYGGVFTIETGYKNSGKEMFETFNGEKPIVILDEFQQNIYGLAQSVHQSTSGLFRPVSKLALKQKSISQQKRKSNNKKKNKAAKKARKKNRRR